MCIGTCPSTKPTAGEPFGAISSLLTATFASTIAETVYIMVSVVGVLGSIVLVGFWLRSQSQIKKLCARIRERLPPDAPAAPVEGRPTLPAGDIKPVLLSGDGTAPASTPTEPMVTAPSER